MRRWFRPRHLVLFLATAALTVLACQEDTPDQPSPSLRITVSDRSIYSDGATIDVIVEAYEADGTTFGTGSVTIAANAGVLDGQGGSVTLSLANGEAKTTYSCNSSECEGSQRITATWNSVTAVARVDVSKVPTAADAGVGFQDGGAQQANPDGGTVVTVNGFSIDVQLERGRIFYGVGDKVKVTASLTADGKVPQTAEELTLKSSLAELSAESSTTRAQSLTLPIDATTGVAVAELHEAGKRGNSVLYVTHSSGAITSVNYEVVAVQQLSWASTQCNGAPCTIMGVRGSGFNERAQVSFKIADALGRPAPGVTVTFSVANPPPGLTISPSDVTSLDGIATANISSGKTIGAFSVKAVVVPNELESLSPTIGIRGAVPANWGFSLYCASYNLPAYVSALPPGNYDVDCGVKLVDRYNNPIGTGTSVFFKSEVGSITNAVPTAAYVAQGDNSGEGVGDVKFSTIGAWPPVDTEPLEPLAGQWPASRDREPRDSPEGATEVRNPRDGLVTLIAYVRGEEFFSDNNGDGQWTSGEPFIDQGEPFVDSNDNGIWDPGEIFVDEAPADGKWNAPNGTWDNSTTIWTETRVLYTGRPKDEAPYSIYSPDPITADCPSGLAPGESAQVSVRFSDARLNRPAKGVLYSRDNNYWGYYWLDFVRDFKDGFGFTWGRYLVDNVTGTACSPTSQSCNWSVRFSSWEDDYVTFPVLVPYNTVVTTADAGTGTGGWWGTPDVCHTSTIHTYYCYEYKENDLTMEDCSDGITTSFSYWYYW